MSGKTGKFLAGVGDPHSTRGKSMSKENDELRHLIEQGFALVHNRLDKIDTRLDKMDARFDQMDARLDKMDARLDKMDTRFDQMDARFDYVDARLKSLELAQAEMRGELRGLSTWLASMDSRFMAIMRPYEPPRSRAEA
ncbi:MAG: hypothetical protein HQL37_01665 [Alphaproteobacteria bacterium]|nr:hypothetical protein [Alphaproteobacteria bacterium]